MTDDATLAMSSDPTVDAAPAAEVVNPAMKPTGGDGEGSSASKSCLSCKCCSAESPPAAKPSTSTFSAWRSLAPSAS
eukprot:3434854-Pyramimonas_sp.AAC.1